jgi:pimeloyl-ACP methyl ester carboxylesterase
MLRRRDVLSMFGACGAWAAAGGRAAAQPAGIAEEPWGAAHLSGTFAKPNGEAPRGPAALIIAGSGPTPRNGTFGTYRQIAQALAAAGIRSLRYDKRGVGRSHPMVAREDDLVLKLFVDDALLAARDIAARPDVSSVAMIGHSEGALIATLAAAEMPLGSIALLAGIGRKLDVVLREQIMAMPLPESLEHVRREALGILDRLARGERVGEVSPENAPLFRPSVQPFLISMFAVDPAAELAKRKLPVLLARGECDIQVAAIDLELLAQARPDAKKLSLAQTNHVFKPAPADVSDRAAQLRSYDASAPLAPGLTPPLIDFVRANAT